MKNLVVLLSFAILFGHSLSLYAARKEVKLTTYYPAPYGDYRQLKATGSDTLNSEIALEAKGSSGAGLVVTNANNVGIGTVTPQAALDISSTASGFLPPRMTTIARGNIDVDPATGGNQVPEGMVIYNVTDHSLEVNRSATLTSPDWVSASGGGVKAMVNFNGLATACEEGDGANECTIRKQKNVAKVVRTSLGYYTIYFTSAMPDANYIVTGMAAYQGATGRGSFVELEDPNPLSTSNFKIEVVRVDSAEGQPYDSEQVHLVIY